MDVKQAKTFYDLMQQYLVFYKEFLEFETKKLDDVANNRIDIMDEHVKKEEVFLLKSRGFEVKREEFLKNVGLENMSMSEVIKTSPEESRGQMSDAFSELSDIVLDLKEINSRCNSMIELRLHRIEKTLNRIEENQQSNYNSFAKSDKKKTDFISRKV
ncbi:MAG: hypothetical protein EOM05_00925 [Clostridia bacterium]|nr:hypothetical protein [Clostridia bacterium]